MLASLDSKRIDVVINQVTISDERKKKYDFSTPYTISGIQALVKKGNEGTIKTADDLKGKKVGYSVSGFEDVLLDTMLRSIGLSNQDVKLVNVNWSLSPSLLTGQVDAVIGAFRNFELNQIHLEKQEGVAFFPEQYGVPVYDELILVANRNNLASKKISAFLTALEQATTYLQSHPDEAWQAFANHKPKELNTESISVERYLAFTSS